MSPRGSLHASWQRPACTRLSNRAILLHCICRLLAHRDASLRRTTFRRGAADLPRQAARPRQPLPVALEPSNRRPGLAR